MTGSQLNDRIFMCFPAGWFAGIIAGTIWGGYHWNDLQVEFGRCLLASVTVSQITTLILSTIVIRKIFRDQKREDT